jgi:transposase-like protein
MKYTDAQKRKAVNLYIQHGTTEASQQSGVPKRTLLRWAKDSDVVAHARDKTAVAVAESARLNVERRERIKSSLLEKIEDLLGRMNLPHIDFKGKDAQMVTYPVATSGDVKNYAVSVAVLIDKYRLEMGESTSRAEISFEQAESRLDEEFAELVKQFEEMEAEEKAES